VGGWGNVSVCVITELVCDDGVGAPIGVIFGDINYLPDEVVST
jgi:hypothetical protein